MGLLKKEETSYSKEVCSESIATDYLQQKDFRILEKRCKTKYGELDIIAKKGNMLCFVEVKVRKNKLDALESVTSKAQQRIENSALLFLSENPDYALCDMRFDDITISGDANISHLDNAWLARS